MANDDDIPTAALKAATRRFAQHGFEGTSIQDIAGDVGVTKQALLYHFATKEDLRRAVLVEMVRHWNEALPKLLLAAAAAEDRFEAVVRELLRFFREDPDRARLLIRHALDRPEESRGLVTEHVRPYVTAVASFITEGREKGTHHADVDPEGYVVLVLLTMLVGVAAAPVLDGLLGGKRKATEARLVTEMQRLAKASLFAPPGARRAPSPRSKKP